MLSASQAVEQTRTMLEWRHTEQPRLDRLHGYLRANQRHRWLPESVPLEVRRIADVARVPVVKLVVDSVVQGLYVDGYRARLERENVPQWDLWQRNRMDSRQIKVHRESSTYGVSYGISLPGDTAPVIRGVSPRSMTVVYGDDDDWPMWALEKRRTEKGKLWRLFDETHTYWVGEEPTDGFDGPRWTFISSEEHGAGVTPVVKFPDTHEADDEVIGEAEPIIPLQDQIDLTTFGLLVAQHYGAFRQRYIIGWLAESEQQKLRASASKLWTFEDSPDDVEVGEFDQTQLGGYINSREASLRHLAAISQTPVNELVGTLVNLSADALVAARDAHNRKRDERKVVRGESWEQLLGLAGSYVGIEPDPEAWVRWRDTDARSLAQTADALGKFAEMLGIPKRALWERAAEAMGASQQELETWEEMASQGGALGELEEFLARQAHGGD